MKTYQRLRWWFEDGRSNPLANHPVYARSNVCIDTRVDIRYKTDGDGLVNFVVEDSPASLAASAVKILARKKAVLEAAGRTLGNKYCVTMVALGQGQPVGSSAVNGAYPMCQSLWWDARDRKSFTNNPSDQARQLKVEGIVSGGTCTITVNGSTTGNIAWNAAPAAMQAAVSALGVFAGMTVTCYSDANNRNGVSALPANPCYIRVVSAGADVTANHMWSVNTSALTGGGTFRLAARPIGLQSSDTVIATDNMPFMYHGMNAQAAILPFFGLLAQALKDGGYSPCGLIRSTQEELLVENTTSYCVATTESHDGWVYRMMTEPEWESKWPRAFIDGTKWNLRAFWESLRCADGVTALPGFIHDSGEVGGPSGAARHGKNNEAVSAASDVAMLAFASALSVFRNAIRAGMPGTRFVQYQCATNSKGAGKHQYRPNYFAGNDGVGSNMKGLLPGADLQCFDYYQVGHSTNNYLGDRPDLDAIGRETKNNWAAHFGHSAADPNFDHWLAQRLFVDQMKAQYAACPQKPPTPYVQPRNETDNTGGLQTADEMTANLIALITAPGGPAIRGLQVFMPYQNDVDHGKHLDWVESINRNLENELKFTGDGEFSRVAHPGV